ncbi:MalY/PatB family protein [Sediminitomix flava]|uniref:cysteine-S-conjugate beta-lyase n=1 Tax=Sediminitomix flava TaxID=379075 RepID=A0A315Z7F4_SEDFL|nr:PatB family C-S lyase [Sediminitomix flava]PWJ40851.1 cystathionine beta-lyase [Sediminitomix flava]
MKYNFDEVISRLDTKTVKYDLREMLFQNSEVIPMWVADMDFRVPKEVEESLQQRVAHPIYGYTIQKETHFFKSAASWLKKRFDWTVSEKDMIFSPGVVPALAMAVQAFTEKGDKVAFFSPVYPPFYHVVEEQGREVFDIPMEIKNNRFELNYALLGEKLSSGVKLLLLSHPHNPGGRVWRKEELQRILELCQKHNVVIISDEIHADLVWWGEKHIPLASITESAKDLVITCLAPSKTFNLAGLACSYLVIENPKLREQYLSIAKPMHLNFGSTFATEALVAAYEHGEEWLSQLHEYVEQNINFFTGYLSQNIPQIKAMKPDATYLVWLDCRELGMEQRELVKFFTQKAGLGLNSGTDFGKEGSGFMRINLACPKSVVEKALAQLDEAVKSL